MYCPVLQSSKAKDVDLDPLLKNLADVNLPDDTKTTLKPNADMNDALDSVASSDPDTILLYLTEGKLTAQQCKMALLKLMRTADADLKAYLQSCIMNVDTLVPTADRAKSSISLPGALQTTGKLIKLWQAVVRHVKTEMHMNGKTDHQQKPQFNLLTGEITVDLKEDELSQSQGVFTLSLEHFRHLVRVRDYLSESELLSYTRSLPGPHCSYSSAQSWS